MRQFLLLLPLLAITLVGCNPTPKTQEPMQNEVINAIMSRRSIRQYHQVPVGRDTIMQIMTCGINAANISDGEHSVVVTVKGTDGYEKVISLKLTKANGVVTMD